MSTPQQGAETLLLQARRFRVVEVQETTQDGTRRPREVIRHAGSVAVVPIVDQQHVCLIRNFRVSVGKTLVEIPAGTLEPDEDPRAAAFRELTEETGYSADNLELLAACYLSPGILDELMHVYRATGLTLGQAAREPGEQIENLIVTWDEALEMIRNGTIQDAKTIVGLLACLGPLAAVRVD